MEFINYIKQQVDIPDKLISELDSIFDRKERPKGTEIFPQDCHCKKVFFFENCFGRVICLKDSTHPLMPEDSFSAQIEGIFYNQPSPCAIGLPGNCSDRSTGYPDRKIRSNRQNNSNDPYRSTPIFPDRHYAIQFKTVKER